MKMRIVAILRKLLNILYTLWLFSVGFVIIIAGFYSFPYIIDWLYEHYDSLTGIEHFISNIFPLWYFFTFNVIGISIMLKATSEGKQKADK
jgi:hypothetical protein